MHAMVQLIFFMNFWKCIERLNFSYGEFYVFFKASLALPDGSCKLKKFWSNFIQTLIVSRAGERGTDVAEAL